MKNVEWQKFSVIRMLINLQGVLWVTFQIYSKSRNQGEGIFESNLPDPSGWWVGIWGSSSSQRRDGYGVC